MKIYFDHNATTPVRAEVKELITQMLGEVGNAASIHGYGRAAQHYVEQARRNLAATLDVDANQVIFNSGATEGNNTVIKYFAQKTDGRGRILVSSIDHPSVIQCGVNVETIPVTADGVVDINQFEAMMSTGDAPLLVSVMLVNNETGVIQPVAEIAKIAKKYGSLVHCDAVQGFGRIRFTRQELGVDYMTLSAHKIGGLQGVGALIIAPRVEVPILLHGGGQERRQRAGTVNVMGIASFGLAAQLAIENLGHMGQIAHWRNQIEKAIKSCASVSVVGGQADRVGNTSLIAVEGQESDVLMMRFDLDGVAVSTGSACSSGSSQKSHVLHAMGLNDSQVPHGFVRISLGHTTTPDEVAQFIKIAPKILAKK